MSDDQIMLLLGQGRKIEAIKLYRDQTGVGLKEALDAVEAMAAGQPPAPAPPQGVPPDAEVQSLLGQGRKLEAIKLYRERTGVGLKEAKDAVEAMEAAEAPGVSTVPALDTDTQLQVIALLEQGRRSQAVRLFRERTGWGRSQAARAVAAMASQYGLTRPPGSGCLGVLLLLLIPLAAGAAAALR